MRMNNLTWIWSTFCACLISVSSSVAQDRFDSTPSDFFKSAQIVNDENWLDSANTDPEVLKIQIPTATAYEAQTALALDRPLSVDTGSAVSLCAAAIVNHQKSLLRNVFIWPAIGVGAVPVSAGAGYFLGSKIGRMMKANSLWSQVSGASIGVSIGFWASLIYFLVKEGINVNEYVSNHRTLNLMRSIAEKETLGLGATLDRLNHPQQTMTQSALVSKMQILTAQNRICRTDGTIISYKKLLKLLNNHH